ncbi:unnamed protein product [Vitrella brassicaformis CCMP3155]|uniref:Uncharacterized protein n=1 Tax=Vitrella brassicaformis (strain CCMP3155) TaxID=1169540 RepID=A0A0G4EQ47_VITBC|nr:unnamed protein product [Vitrella brassicaformis CCMP3155]|eukprot:CEL99554.1 unnamed protein product [Vitrella brassicaformis CCMP3155]
MTASLSSQLDSLSQRLHEISPTADREALMPLLEDLVSNLHFDKNTAAGQQKATRLRKLLPPLAKGANSPHQPLLAMIQSARSRRCRRWATIAFSKLLQAGYPFCFRSAQPDLVKQLLDNMALLLPTDASASTDIDNAVYAILLEVIAVYAGGVPASFVGIEERRSPVDYREIIVTKHEAFLHRAESILRHAPRLYGLGYGVLFLIHFYQPLAPDSCAVLSWMRLVSLAIDITIDGSAARYAHYDTFLLDRLRWDVNGNVVHSVENGRDAELFAAIEEHLVPRVGRLVEVMTTSNDDNTRRLAMSMIGSIFYLAHASYIKHYPDPFIQSRVDEVLSEPVRVLLAHPCALKTMASLLKTAGTAVDSRDKLTRNQQIEFNIMEPNFVALHLSDPSLNKHAREHVHALIEAGWVPAIVTLMGDDRLLKIERFADIGLPGCLNSLYKMAQRDERVACDKTVASVCCDLLAKHARGDIDIAIEDEVNITNSAVNTIMSIISEFVAYGDRQVERGKIATNVFRIYVFKLPSVKELMAMPREGNKLPKKIRDQLDWLYETPSRFHAGQQMRRSIDELMAARATGLGRAG